MHNYESKPFSFFFFLQIFTLAVVIRVMIHFNDVARESSVQIITNATILLLKRGRQRYTGWEQVSHFLKNLQLTLGFTHTVKSGTVLPWSNISWDGAEYVSNNQHRLSWQPYSKITNLKKPTVTSWEPVRCRRWINCSDTTRHLKSIIYSALVLNIYMYLHTRLIESSHSWILQLKVAVFFFSSCLFWPNSLTCSLSVCVSVALGCICVFFFDTSGIKSHVCVPPPSATPVFILSFPLQQKQAGL